MLTAYAYAICVTVAFGYVMGRGVKALVELIREGRRV